MPAGGRSSSSSEVRAGVRVLSKNWQFKSTNQVSVVSAG
jgi:hypothetical protein